MNNTFEDIKKYPYTYLDELYENSNPSILYQYGPYLLMTNDIDKYINATSYKKSPIFKMLLDIIDIIRTCENEKNTFADVKRFIMQKLKFLLTDNDFKLYTSTVRDICEKCMENIKNIQKSERLLESVMIDARPIVPYSQIIKAPGMDSSSELNRSNNISEGILGINDNIIMLDIIKDILSLPDSKILDIINKLLVTYPTDILNRYSEFFRTDDYYKIYDSTNTLERNNLSADILNVFANSGKMDYVILYYTLVYIYFNFNRDDYSEIIKNLSSINMLFQKDINVTSAMEALSILTLPSFENTVFDSDIITNMEYEKDKNLEKLMGMADITSSEMFSKKYKLDKLLAYIYNARRFKTDSYTNSLFLNNNTIIEGYSYIENGDDYIMVCEINENSLAVPVIDLSDNYKMKLILIDKDSNVTVTTNFNLKEEKSE